MLRHGGNNTGSPSSNHNTAQSNSHNKHGKPSSKKAPLVASLQYWCWMICGVAISFLSIDYSMRALFPETPTTATDDATVFLPGSTGLLSMASSRTALMDGFVDTTTPLQSMNDLNAQDNNYAYDSLAHIPPDPKQHAILIPYRDRPFHLELFLEYMGPYLNLHFPHATFDLWIIEQDDIDLFNRAWLANVGLREIVKASPTTSCVIFHDVDLVPNMTSHVPYTTCQWPIQLGSELQHFNWSVPYPAYAGGITSMSLKHWQLINGLGNGA